MKIFSKFIYLIFFSIALNGCIKKDFFKRSDVKDNPVNVEERVKKNVEEGRGVRFALGGNKGGTFDFASANQLWRASVETLDFVPLVNASYSGGIIITDWFNGGDNTNRELKITIRFLTNEIRSDALNIKIFTRKCEINLNNCSFTETNKVLVSELTKEILKKAAIYKQQDEKKKNKK